MERRLFLLLLLVFVEGCLCGVAGTRFNCPHDDQGLVRWSDPLTWASNGNKVPAADTVAVVDRPVLLNTNPPTLRGIHIIRGGRLVFKPEVEMKLRVGFIRIEGEMVVGSHECPYEGLLNITLTGRRGDIDITRLSDLRAVDFGEKFIGVDAGGSLQIHGVKRRSWTKLNATAYPQDAKQKKQVLWDHQAMKTAGRHQYEDRDGINVYIFSPEGEVVTFENFRTNKYVRKFERRLRPIRKFFNFLRDVRDSNYVMIAVRRQLIPTGESMDDMSPYHDIFEAVERLLGGNRRTKLRQFQPGSSYVLFAKKGKPIMSREELNQRKHGVRLARSDPATGLDFLISVAGNGRKCDFKVLKERSGGQQLTLTHDVSSWRPGDRVVVFSTDYDWEQAEEATLIRCRQCKDNQILIEKPLKYIHWGEIEDGVDERGEVALLTRDIVIHGEMQRDCPRSNGNCGECPASNPYCGKYEYDTFGGHIIILKGFKNVTIEGAELYHMGQQTDLGRYPIHFHMTGNVSGIASVVGNSIHHTFSRCVVVHATHQLWVEDNVCYDHLGHGYFIEDGGEKNTVFKGNLGGGTKPSNLTSSDATPGTFWITSPLSSLLNNVAAGGTRVGFWFIFPNQPMGPSQELGLFKWQEAKEKPLTLFCNNVAHSYGRAGLFLGNSFTNDSRVTGCTSQYSPNVNGTIKQVILRRFTGYKNVQQNAWVVGGAVRMDRASMADSAIQVFFNDRAFGRQMLTNSILVGETRNKGSIPTRKRRTLLKKYLRGVTFNGRLDVDGVWFKNFKGPKSGAISFLTSNIRIGATFNNTKWGFAESSGQSTPFNRVYAPYIPKKSKVRTATFEDLDGSVTGIPHTQVMNPTQFVGTSYQCTSRRRWNMAVCAKPSDYSVVFFKFRNGFAAAVQELTSTDNMDRRHQGGGKEGSFLVKKEGTYIIDYWHSTIREKHLYTEKGLLVQATGLQEGDSIIIGLCLPAEMSFKFPASKPRMNTWEEFKNETKRPVIYFNDVHRILFMKFFGRQEGVTKREIHQQEKASKLPLNVFTPRGVREFTADCKAAARMYEEPAGPTKDAVDSLPPQIPSLPKTDQYPPKSFGADDTTNLNLNDNPQY